MGYILFVAAKRDQIILNGVVFDLPEQFTDEEFNSLVQEFEPGPDEGWVNIELEDAYLTVRRNAATQVTLISRK